jgi:bacteriocin biosynthesis cyclodehydratase domain-containing protein
LSSDAVWTWAWPFTLTQHQGEIWLIAGEDVRFALQTSQPDAVLRGLQRIDGQVSLPRLLEEANEARDELSQILEHLRGERLLIPADASHPRAGFHVELVGDGELARALKETSLPLGGTTTTSGAVWLFCQDSLDYHAVLEFNATCLAEHRRWCWITTGPSARAYLSPLFHPDAGPCAACLLHHFRRLSPAPEVYDALIQHGRQQGDFQPGHFAAAGRDLVARLAAWKLSLLDQPHSALYRLHVVEADALTTSSHLVFYDPECLHCRR